MDFIHNLRKFFPHKMLRQKAFDTYLLSYMISKDYDFYLSTFRLQKPPQWNLRLEKGLFLSIDPRVFPVSSKNFVVITRGELPKGKGGGMNGLFINSRQDCFTFHFGKYCINFTFH